MLRRKGMRRALAVLALVGPGTASAASLSSTTPVNPITFTGDVERDFNSAVTPRIGTIVDNPNPRTGEASIGDVAQADWITAQGHTTGWNIKDVRLYYDSKSDSLAVGVNFFGIAGDADGDGNPGGTDPRTATAGGVDMPHLGGRESIAVAFDLNNDGKPDIIAGVPADKSTAGPGTDGFAVSMYKGDGAGKGFGFGSLLPDQQGSLAFDPDAAHPDFEFLIKNFSKIPGFQLDKAPFGFEFSSGIGVMAFAGTPDDIIAGEDSVPLTHLSPQAIPEPATLLAWSVVACGAAWRLRRRRRLA